jgi:hypothetical protein
MSVTRDVALFKLLLQTDADLKNERGEPIAKAFLSLRKLRPKETELETRGEKEANENAVTVAPVRNDIPKNATMAMASARLVAVVTLLIIQKDYYVTMP